MIDERMPFSDNYFLYWHPSNISHNIGFLLCSPLGQKFSATFRRKILGFLKNEVMHEVQDSGDNFNTSKAKPLLVKIFRGSSAS